jgi:hypothetical protein
MVASKYSIEPGSKIGNVIFLERSPKIPGVTRKDIFQCNCGKTFSATLSNVSSGKTKSCGCLARSLREAQRLDPSVKAVKAIWQGILFRCENPSAKFYSQYGGRGIYVCERWKDFNNFFQDMGTRPSKHHSLDRINNDGPYSPDNCRWATRVEQQNNRRCNVMLTLNGESKTVPQWSREIGINQKLLRSRVKLGWSDEKILTTPARPKLPKGSGDAQARFREKMKMRRQAGSY